MHEIHITRASGEGMHKKIIQIKCEGCSKGSYRDLPIGWVQVGSSRFKNAQDGLASWCRKCTPKAVSKRHKVYPTYSLGNDM